MKKRYTWPLFLLGAIIIPRVLFSQIDYKGFPQWSLQKKDSTEYALYTPQHLQPGKRYPIVLFMHGCCGVGNHASLRNAVDPPVRMWHRFGANKQVVPTYIIAPATSRGWKQHFKNLKAVMDELVAHHQGDPQRIYVCGFSMGGEGTYRIIQEYPGYFAAAIPMGMNFSGDSSQIKDIPVWANQGETDYYSRNLRKQVAAVRALNGFTQDTGSVWITGVNPRYSNFKGVGHVVQWPAASTQDLTGWAYSKINDGYKYPSLFFMPLVYPIPAVSGQPVTLNVVMGNAGDTINKVNLYVNHVLYTTLHKAPYRFTFMPAIGDDTIEATAFNNHGKQATATTIVKINIPVQWTTASRLPPSFAGNYYQTRLTAKGNGTLHFSLAGRSPLPPGIQLYPDGTLKGVATAKGSYRIGITAVDEDNDSSSIACTLIVQAKKPGEVLVTGPATDSTVYELSKIKIGEAPFFNSKDSLLSGTPEEINFSAVGNYKGLTFIRTNVNDAGKSTANFLHFTTDEDVVLYIAYETIDKPTRSSVPAWLQSYKKEKETITAQYRYFDVYSKPCKKGTIVLPGADAAHNGVSSNYFVMIKKQ